MARRTGPLLLALCLALSACGPFGVDRFGHAAGGGDHDRIGELIDQPAGPVIELGRVPIEGDREGRTVTIRGFRNQAGGTCVETGSGMGCSSGAPDGRSRQLPAEGPLGLGYSSGDEVCIEADVQDGITDAAVTDRDGEVHRLVSLPLSRQLGMNLFIGCWVGAEPLTLETTTPTGAVAYRVDF